MKQLQNQEILQPSGNFRGTSAHLFGQTGFVMFCELFGQGEKSLPLDLKQAIQVMSKNDKSLIILTQIVITFLFVL